MAGPPSIKIFILWFSRGDRTGFFGPGSPPLCVCVCVSRFRFLFFPFFFTTEYSILESIRDGRRWRSLPSKKKLEVQLFDITTIVSIRCILRFQFLCFLLRHGIFHPRKHP